MALIAPFIALLGRFVGRILTTTLGWASVMLFGRVPRGRQVWLAALTFGSIAWVVILAGVVQPQVGTRLLAFAPVPDWVDRNVVRIGMLIAAIVLPAILGVATVLLVEPRNRPRGRALGGLALRGYLLVPALAVTLVVLAVAGTIRKLSSVAHRRQDAHVSMVVRPERYDALVDSLDETLRSEKLVTGRKPGPSVLTIPARLLARIAGGGVSSMVPDRLVVLEGPSLSVSVYPSDLAFTGSEDAVARGRAMVARDIRSQDAWFTTSSEAQELEDRLAELEKMPPEERSKGLEEADRKLVDLTLEEDAWEVLYRRRLQLVSGPDGDLKTPKEQRHQETYAPGGGSRWNAGSAVALVLAALTALDLLVVAITSRTGRMRRGT